VRAVPDLPEGLADRQRGRLRTEGELYQRYHEGMEDQLGALGLILNRIPRARHGLPLQQRLPRD
jgi:hypothetical protein